MSRPYSVESSILLKCTIERGGAGWDQSSLLPTHLRADLADASRDMIAKIATILWNEHDREVSHEPEPMS